MKTSKITPKQRKEMAARVQSGEQQKAIAAEYGISPGYLSKIVKREMSGQPSKPKVRDFSNWTRERLLNRFYECHREISDHNDLLQTNQTQAERLEKNIAEMTERLKRIEDATYRKSVEDGIISYKTQLTFLRDNKRAFFALALLYQEVSAILHELSKRGDTDLPVITRLQFHTTQKPAASLKASARL